MKTKRKKPLAKSVKAIVRKELHKSEETKYQDFYVTGYNPYNNASSSDLSLLTPTTIAQGSTGQTRTGDKLRIKSIEIDIVFRVNPTPSTWDEKNPWVRLIVFQWHPVMSASAPNAQSVLEGVATQATVISPYNANNFGDFTILYDQTFALSYDVGNKQRAHKHIMITPGKNRFFKPNIVYQPGSSNLGANLVYVMPLTALPATDASHFGPLSYMYARTRYTDD